MTNETLNNLLTGARKADLLFNTDAETSNGWKISIQGKNIKDAMYLYSALNEFLYENNIPFKVATDKRFNSSNIEQSKKAMTIYVPNSFNHLELAEDIYTLTMNYSGWNNIKTPTSYEHYAGGLFFRNDRAENGEYIPAN